RAGDGRVGVHARSVPVEPGRQRVRAHPVGPDDGHAGRRRADRDRPGRHRRLPPRLGRHLADPRDDQEALRPVLVPVLRCWGVKVSLTVWPLTSTTPPDSLAVWTIELWDEAVARCRACAWAR